MTDDQTRILMQSFGPSLQSTINFRLAPSSSQAAIAWWAAPYIVQSTHWRLSKEMPSNTQRLWHIFPWSTWTWKKACSFPWIHFLGLSLGHISGLLMDLLVDFLKNPLIDLLTDPLFNLAMDPLMNLILDLLRDPLMNLLINHFTGLPILHIRYQRIALSR